MPVPRLLLAILQHNNDHNQQQSIKSDNTKRTREDDIEEVIGVVREGSYASDLGGCYLGVLAEDILDEGWGGGV